jgi:hypothetical protein
MTRNKPWGFTQTMYNVKSFKKYVKAYFGASHGFQLPHMDLKFGCDKI